MSPYRKPSPPPPPIEPVFHVPWLARPGVSSLVALVISGPPMVLIGWLILGRVGALAAGLGCLLGVTQNIIQDAVTRMLNLVSK